MLNQILWCNINNAFICVDCMQFSIQIVQQKLHSQMVASFKILFAKSKNPSERNRAERLYGLKMKRCEVSNWKVSNLHINEFVKVIEFLIKVHSSKTPRFLFCYIKNTFPSRLMFCSLAFHNDDGKNRTKQRPQQ